MARASKKILIKETQQREHRQSENVALSSLIQTLNGIQLLFSESVFKVRSYAVAKQKKIGLLCVIINCKVSFKKIF